VYISYSIITQNYFDILITYNTSLDKPFVDFKTIKDSLLIIQAIYRYTYCMIQVFYNLSIYSKMDVATQYHIILLLHPKIIRWLVKFKEKTNYKKIK